MRTIKLIKEVDKGNFVVRTELHDGKEFGCKPFEVVIAYTKKGDYIGDERLADKLTSLGIEPEKISKNHNVCSIGFCKKDNKWFGWSHRAIYGFAIGNKVKKGDCGYEPTSPEDMLDSMIRFWIEPDREHCYKDEILNQNINVKDPRNKQTGLGCLLEYKTTRKKDKTNLIHLVWNKYPKKWGKGEWTAKNIKEVKQMAIDFAKGVS